MSAPFVIGQGLRGSVNRVWAKPAQCKIQLNINMGLAGRQSTAPWLKERYKVIKNLLENNTDWELVNDAMVDRQVEHHKHNMLVREIVFVACIELGGYARPTDDMRQFISSLADVLGQGCIAMYEPDIDRGDLIGSNTNPWGEFDSSRFINIEPEEA